MGEETFGNPNPNDPVEDEPTPMEPIPGESREARAEAPYDENESKVEGQEKPVIGSGVPPSASTRSTAPQPLSPSDERTWAMLAHLSVLLNLVTGFLGPVAALLIYLIFKDRSRYVAYQSLQSMIFQLIWWVGGGALIGAIWAVTGILSAVIIGILLIPFALLATLVLLAAPVIAIIYGVIAAIETSQGHDFKYWLVGDWVRDTFHGA